MQTRVRVLCYAGFDGSPRCSWERCACKVGCTRVLRFLYICEPADILSMPRTLPVCRSRAKDAGCSCCPVLQKALGQHRRVAEEAVGLLVRELGVGFADFLEPPCQGDGGLGRACSPAYSEVLADASEAPRSTGVERCLCSRLDRSAGGGRAAAGTDWVVDRWQEASCTPRGYGAAASLFSCLGRLDPPRCRF